MFTDIVEGTAHLGLKIPLDSFPQLLRDHLKEFSAVPDIELLGRDLVKRDFPPESTSTFMRRVCKFGGYAGIAARVLRHNHIDTICQALRDAVRSLETGESIAKALKRVNDLHELGRLGSPSFASKHLRFLRPDICAVFDSILRTRLPYSFDAEGYSDFCNDCASLASALAERQIPNPRTRKGGSWFAADVEGALYMFARNLRQSE